MLKQVFRSCILKHIGLTRLGTDSGAADFRRSAHATDPATTVSRSFRENFSKTLARKIFRKTDLVDAINLVQKSSKSELSSRFLSRSKFWGAKKVEFSKGRLPPEDGSVRPQTLGKRVSDDPRHFIFQRRKLLVLDVCTYIQ